jgi:hypothetical protein
MAVPGLPRGGYAIYGTAMSSLTAGAARLSKVWVAR